MLLLKFEFYYNCAWSLHRKMCYIRVFLYNTYIIYDINIIYDIYLHRSYSFLCKLAKCKQISSYSAGKLVLVVCNSLAVQTFSDTNHYL